jgi:hypothetical protein
MRRWTPGLFAAALLVLAGCGGDGGTAPPSPLETTGEETTPIDSITTTPEALAKVRFVARLDDDAKALSSAVGQARAGDPGARSPPRAAGSRATR